MTEQIQDQISAFIDDELSPEECAFFVRRLERDPDTRAKVMRYMTLGAALREELLPPDPGILRRRINDSLDGVETTATAKRSSAVLGARLTKPLVSTGIAAGVAMLALFVLRGANEADVDADRSGASPPLQALQSSEPPSYVVPQEPRVRAVTLPIRYTNYLMHHGEYASGLNRTLVRSNVVSNREADIAVEGEEAFE